MTRMNADRAAALVLIVLYSVGLAAHLIVSTRALMLTLTPYVLVAGGASVLLLSMQRGRPTLARFAVWCSIVFVATFVAEVVGVHTGLIFGSYSYGRILGIKAAGVPLVIGFNWVLVVLGASLLAERVIGTLGTNSRHRPGLAEAVGARAESAAKMRWRTAARPTGAFLLLALSTGLLSAVFDRTMEPAAVALGYWSWKNGVIPLQNYAAWFVLAAAAALLYRVLRLRLSSRLPIVYLVVQWCFFFGLDIGLARHPL